MYVPYNGLEGYDRSNHSTVQASPFGSCWKTPQELFWSMYGMSGYEKPHIIKFSFLVPSNMSDRDDFYHPNWTERSGKTLFQFYHIIWVVTMFNMMVAYFSLEADEASENEDAYWKFARTQVNKYKHI